MRKETILQDGWNWIGNVTEEDLLCAKGRRVAVTLPHTWNGRDGQDGGADYARCLCQYERDLYIPCKEIGRRYYLEVGGASYDCRVFLNGVEMVHHRGGYACFRADLTEVLEERENRLILRVSNHTQCEIYPQMADFTFYGGLHRPVKLIEVDETHFDLDHFGSCGVRAWSEVSADRSAWLHLESFVTSPQGQDVVRYTLSDREGKTVAVCYRGAAEGAVALPLTELHLWQGVDDPYLYTLRAELLRHNQVIDEVCLHHGFRFFSVDPQKGFFLNGIPTPLRGVSRHQDRAEIGNALTEAHHREDAALMEELGANTVRLAHYQHSPEFYDLCDRYGFVVWAEIPFISKMNESDAAHENCKCQLRELITQNFNHPSICFWGISNEITIGGNPPILRERLEELNTLAHEWDPTRLTTMAQVSTLPREDGQNRLTDVVAYNHYFGWYGGALTDNEAWLDAFHQEHPDRPLGLSEYGCEGIVTYHTDTPAAGDYSEEYQALYHEHMLRVLESRPWIWGSYVWNLFDFGSDLREEGGVKGRNNKGLVSMDRRIRKDAFYLYQAAWGKEPMVHLCGKGYEKRMGDHMTVKVYSNCPRITLLVDGQEVAIQEGKRVFVFENIPLHKGLQAVTAMGGGVQDTAFFEQTDILPPRYTCPRDKEREGVTNWFDTADMSRRGEIVAVEGFYSVLDRVDRLLQSEEAARILTHALSSLSGMSLKPAMLQMMAEQTPEELFAHPLVPLKEGQDARAMLLFLNEALQKIPKTT